MAPEPLIPLHGGYRKLKSFQVAQLAYDLTVRFCNRYIDRRSRTHDQMVQAARSGVQNIAEGSVASGTSKKMELKLTNVARASLEELRLDYEDYLRHRAMPLWPADHPALIRFKERRCKSLEEIRTWVAEEVKDTDKHGPARTGGVRERPCPSVYVANAALSLLNLACHLLNRQVVALADAFEKDGGFTERLYRARLQKRQGV
ncbi:MAG TPA: four helix bundle suffix domain-containing protein [Kiritimatiellia bacterium]|jgi:four helix bundle suffix protein